MVTSSIIEAHVSVKRLSEFVEAEELQPDARKLIPKANLQAGDEVFVFSSSVWASLTVDLSGFINSRWCFLVEYGCDPTYP
jgi:hypothetical protein